MTSAGHLNELKKVKVSQKQLEPYTKYYDVRGSSIRSRSWLTISWFARLPWMTSRQLMGDNRCMLYSRYLVYVALLLRGLIVGIPAMVFAANTIVRRLRQVAFISTV